MEICRKRRGCLWVCLVKIFRKIDGILSMEGIWEVLGKTIASSLMGSRPGSGISSRCLYSAEGCPVSLFNSEQKAAVLRIFKAFNNFLPDESLRIRLESIRRHMDRTYFTWIGGFGLGDPYYFRLHSPVAWCEVDFHCGSKWCYSPLRCDLAAAKHQFGLLDQHVSCKTSYPHHNEASERWGLR